MKPAPPSLSSEEKRFLNNPAFSLAALGYVGLFPQLPLSAVPLHKKAKGRPKTRPK
jgi:hypothetical protein